MCGINIILGEHLQILLFGITFSISLWFSQTVLKSQTPEEYIYPTDAVEPLSLNCLINILLSEKNNYITFFPGSFLFACLNLQLCK